MYLILDGAAVNRVQTQTTVSQIESHIQTLCVSHSKTDYANKFNCE